MHCTEIITKQANNSNKLNRLRIPTGKRKTRYVVYVPGTSSGEKPQIEQNKLSWSE